MADSLTKKQRSANMSRIRSKNTNPEMVVRELVQAIGFRFRPHHSGLPGKPDLVFPRHRKAAFVHGCFWHHHRCTEGQRAPKSRLEYWGPKITGNVRRDRLNLRRLRRLGWAILVVWECQTVRARKMELTERLRRFLGASLAEKRRGHS
jgi:DNA mismatch endonuclease, patch repair protein